MAASKTIAGVAFDGSSNIDIPITGLSDITANHGANVIDTNTTPQTAAIVTTVGTQSPNIDTTATDHTNITKAQVKTLVDTINSLQAEVAALRALVHGAIRLT